MMTFHSIQPSLSNRGEARMTHSFLKHTGRALASGLLVLGAAGMAQAADPIRIGAPLSLTGSLADEGAKEQQGLDMCVDAVNAKGGVKVGANMRKLEAVKYDYQSETSRAVQIVQRLVTVDKVDLLFAPYATGYIQELVVIRRQMANLGMTVPIVTMTAGASYPEFGQNLGPLANNVSTNAWWHPSATYKDDYIFGGAPAYTKQFMDKYKKE